MAFKQISRAVRFDANSNLELTHSDSIQRACYPASVTQVEHDHLISSENSIFDGIQRKFCHALSSVTLKSDYTFEFVNVLRDFFGSFFACLHFCIHSVGDLNT